jgi:hypothetical protein
MVYPHPLGVHHPKSQIIVGVLAGGRAHNRILSCHKHQNSKLTIVRDIVPDIEYDIEILFDIVIINLRYLSIFYILYRFFIFDIEKKPLILGPVFKFTLLFHSI